MGRSMPIVVVCIFRKRLVEATNILTEGNTLATISREIEQWNAVRSPLSLMRHHTSVSHYARVVIQLKRVIEVVCSIWPVDLPQQRVSDERWSPGAGQCHWDWSIATSANLLMFIMCIMVPNKILRSESERSVHNCYHLTNEHGTKKKQWHSFSWPKSSIVILMT